MAILGIHTDVPSEKQKDIGNSHAWISVEKHGTKRSFSLYPDNNEKVREAKQEKGWDGSGKTHVREGVEPDRKPTASLFKEITPQQEKKLDEVLAEHRQYSSRSNNCSHFVADVSEKVAGVKLSNVHQERDLNGSQVNVPSPVGLERSIKARELDPKTETRIVAERPPEKTQPPAQEPGKKQRPPIRSFREIHPDSGKGRSR